MEKINFNAPAAVSDGIVSDKSSSTAEFENEAFIYNLHDREVWDKLAELKEGEDQADYNELLNRVINQQEVENNKKEKELPANIQDEGQNKIEFEDPADEYYGRYLKLAQERKNKKDEPINKIMKSSWQDLN